MSVNLQHLRAFHAIASEGRVSRAARRLNMAQPTLSQQLKALEDRHQVALFDGRKPPLRLTRKGEALYALTERLFSTVQAVDELLGEGGQALASSVRLGSDSPIYAARLAARLRAEHPDVSIRVRLANARETLKGLEEAKLDVAIVSDPPGDSHYAYTPLFADHLMVALPADHPMARGPAFPIKALGDERLLMREQSSRTRSAIESLMAAEGVTPSDVIELNSRDTIREGVALKLGLSLFISSECPPDPRLAYVALEPPQTGKAPVLTGYVVCLAERRRTPLMRSVMQIAEELATLSPEPVGRR
jgi:DNA-binding transcriptional LysR family regulator